MKNIKSRCKTVAERYILLPLNRVVGDPVVDNYKLALNAAILLMRYIGLIIRGYDVIPKDYRGKTDLLVDTLIAKILIPELFSENHEYRGAAGRFLPDEHITAMRRALDDNNELIQSLCSQLMEDRVIMECMCQFWLVLHASCLIRGDRGYADYNISRVHKLDSSAKTLTIKALSSIHRNTKRNIKRFKKLIIDRESDKFDLTASQVAKFLSTVAALFIPAGYMYNYFLLGPFGIDSSSYFTIPDYVSSSITAIRESIASMTFFFVAVVVTRLRASKKRVRSVLSSKYRMSISVKEPLQPWFGWYLMTCSIMLSIALFHIGSSAFYTSVGYSGLSILVMLVDRYVFRYFKRPIPIRTIIVAFALFGTALWSSASSRVFELRNGFEHESKNYTIRLKHEHSLPSSDLVILTSTSEYYIFITRGLSAYIVDRESVEHIEIKSDQHWIRDIFDFLTL